MRRTKEPFEQNWLCEPLKQAFCPVHERPGLSLDTSPIRALFEQRQQAFFID
jgi:hypothetical protein